MYHHEGFIELMHQEGKRLKRRFGGVRGGIEKIINAQKRATASKQSAMDKIQEVKKNAKRKFKKKSRKQVTKDVEAALKEALDAKILEQDTVRDFYTVWNCMLDD